jgi:hypothetical protein
MSYLARGPIGTMGIDGKTSAAGRRRPGVYRSTLRPEAAA